MRWVIAGFAGLVLACPAAALGAPRVPDGDGVVLERSSAAVGDPEERRARELRAALARDPRNLDAALRLAAMHLGKWRSDSDPRQLGRAQAALASWWALPEAPTAVLVMRATIRQASHDFVAARADLESALAREPRNAQAWLTLATVQQVGGDLAAARSSCARLPALVPALVHVTCAAGVEGMSGRAAQALAALSTAIESSGDAAPGVLAWALTLEAELAQRVGQPAVAERSFRAALALDPRDAYARAAYADFLLDAGRPREVLRLIAPDTPVDSLLLRYVLAARAAGEPGDAQTRLLTARFAAARARGDRVHLREEARFALHVGGDAAAALALAIENWKSQREPADLRIALEAAVAAGDARPVRPMIDWARASRLEGEPIARALSLLGRV